MSFFYDGRLPVYAWGGVYDDPATMFSMWDYYAASDDYNNGYNVTPPLYTGVPISENGPRLATQRRWPRGSNSQNAQTVVSQEVPCDKQFPWRKIESDVTGVVIGHTLHGELYACIGSPSGIGLDDVLSSRWWRASDNLNAQNGFDLSPSQYAKSYVPFRGPLIELVAANNSGGMPRFRRLVFNGVSEAIKDFSLAASGTRAASSAGTVTVVTKSGRVYVSGLLTNGSHGVPPTTTRPDASLIAQASPNENVVPFYVPKSPSSLPIVTEVTLPGSIKAASAPSGSSNCVIGEDGQLYYWWWDSLQKAMYPPKKFTGFVKYVSVLSGGSGYRVQARGSSPERRTFSWALTFPTPAGGRAAKATCQVVDGEVTHVSITDGGEGYTSPPVPVLADQDDAQLNLGGQGAQFESHVFDDTHAFSHTTSAGRGFVLGSDGALYLFSLSKNIQQLVVGATPQEFLSPVKWHSQGPYKFARGNVEGYAGNGCVVGANGTLYVMTNGVRGVSGQPASSALNDICVDVDVAGEIQSPNFMRFRLGDEVVVYESHVLLPAGTGYAAAESHSVRLTGFQNSACIVAVKNDGSLVAAGKNNSGALGDGSPLSATRRALEPIATQAKWLDVCVFGLLDVTQCYAIRKDAICREIDQPMEYYPDDYYRTLQ
jgi:hypothetical protein